mmetsp:Transcript_26779/g.50674  ORF Transcript_26779/g.50674 Transcript_26779/m.50674 type:complete len:210 (-) Transcript_26779:533-1162(-)
MEWASTELPGGDFSLRGGRAGRSLQVAARADRRAPLPRAREPAVSLRAQLPAAAEGDGQAGPGRPAPPPQRAPRRAYVPAPARGAVHARGAGADRGAHVQLPGGPAHPAGGRAFRGPCAVPRPAAGAGADDHLLGTLQLRRTRAKRAYRARGGCAVPPPAAHWPALAQRRAMARGAGDRGGVRGGVPGLLRARRQAGAGGPHGLSQAHW